MNIDIEITADEGIPEKTATALGFVGLARALCQEAQKLGVTKEQLIEHAPAIIAAAWD